MDLLIQKVADRMGEKRGAGRLIKERCPMWWKKGDKDSSSVTVSIRGEDGREREVLVPSKEFQEWIRAGKAKRIYKVLIKGPWEGFHENFWELSPENVADFVVDDEVAYAICHFENGVPQYSLTSKVIWYNFEEIGEIMSNPKLELGQKIAKVMKIIG